MRYRNYVVIPREIFYYHFLVMGIYKCCELSSTLSSGLELRVGPSYVTVCYEVGCLLR
jgi:hypothetical protein